MKGLLPDSLLQCLHGSGPYVPGQWHVAGGGLNVGNVPQCLPCTLSWIF